MLTATACWALRMVLRPLRIGVAGRHHKPAADPPALPGLAC
ncbi:hypothetical protein I553_5987 [Mycobacterium xenopi 4042]|uniref:Uncharacterized protein n=1 Tax=Mycobacterium xenopi 4042 TaxID=1299334 RepID=X8BDA2_MYCXE|nr:hypothetical protein I553_5987 [Mycobacterium xenopi 4042]